MKTVISLSLGVFLLSGMAPVWADKAKEEEMARMQRQMNQEVMERPFLAEEAEKVDAYIKEASKNLIKPLEYTGQNWRQGYTCHDLLRYSWNEYRDCSYYHHHHGRYYPYPGYY